MLISELFFYESEALAEIFALEWVQQHIATFGGDPERIVMWVYL